MKGLGQWMLGLSQHGLIPSQFARNERLRFANSPVRAIEKITTPHVAFLHLLLGGVLKIYSSKLQLHLVVPWTPLANSLGDKEQALESASRDSATRLRIHIPRGLAATSGSAHQHTRKHIAIMVYLLRLRASLTSY